MDAFSLCSDGGSRRRLFTTAQQTGESCNPMTRLSMRGPADRAAPHPAVRPLISSDAHAARSGRGKMRVKLPYPCEQHVALLRERCAPITRRDGPHALSAVLGFSLHRVTGVQGVTPVSKTAHVEVDGPITARLGHTL
jgi:hypothetical protein